MGFGSDVTTAWPGVRLAPVSGTDIYFVILSKIFQHYLKLHTQLCFGSGNITEVIPVAAMSSAVIIIPDSPESI